MAIQLREPVETTPSSSHSNPLISHQKLRQLYSTMLQCRLLGARARILEKQQGFKNELFSSVGLEAMAVGAAIDLRPADTVAPPHRDFIVSYLKGMPITTVFRQFYRRNPGSKYGRSSPDESRDAQLNIVLAASDIAAQLELCIDIAFANQAKKNDNIVMAFSGETPIPLKEWHDALRFAGQRSLPIVFVRRSRPSGGSGPVNFESAGTVPPSEAVECGFPAITVDGNDPVAVYRVAQEAIERARSGGRPTLIEAQIFPGCRPSHNARAQRRAEQEIEQMKSNDPIVFMEHYLRGKGLFSEEWKNEIIAAFRQELESAANVAENDSSGACS
jgi:2-oxoisovalerate dehydrogenase E1 component alpha subunit